jgi:hypothetical protein
MSLAISIFVLAAAIQSPGSPPASGPATDSKPTAEILPAAELKTLVAGIRRELPENSDGEGAKAQQQYLLKSREKLDAFIVKHAGKIEAEAAHVARATLSLAGGATADAIAELEAVMAALEGAAGRAELTTYVDALKWYCEAAPAKARAALAKLADKPEPIGGAAKELLQKAVAAESMRVGNSILDFEAKTTAGAIVSPASLRGKVALLHFWSSGNKDSIEQIRKFKKLVRARGGDGFEIIGVCLDGPVIRSAPGGAELSGEGEIGLRRFCEDFGVPWPQIYTGLGKEAGLAKTLNVGAHPFGILIDRAGVIRCMSTSAKELTAAAEAQLAAK